MSLWSESSGVGADLVLLHGWGMNAAVWTPLLPALEARWRVTRLELPGHGASESVAGTLEAWAEACLAVAPQRAVWLGWSLGGLVALEVAKQAPERVEQLCLMAATPKFVQDDDWLTAMPSGTFDQFAANLAQDADTTLRRFLALQVRGSEAARPLLRQLSEALGQRPEASARGLADGLNLLQGSDLRKVLAELSVPLAWLLGERDTLVPAGLAAQLEGMSVHMQAGAAHAPFLSHPYEFIEWMEQSCGQ